MKATFKSTKELDEICIDKKKAIDKKSTAICSQEATKRSKTPNFAPLSENTSPTKIQKLYNRQKVMKGKLTKYKHDKYISNFVHSKKQELRINMRRKHLDDQFQKKRQPFLF